jgi:3',5'-cyclic-AMP phosphodiesterase
MRVFQMSDCHLFAEAKQDFHGIYPEQRFRQILNAAKAHAGPTDHLILTGDLAQDEKKQTYHRLRDCLTSWPGPFHTLAGNHDAPEWMDLLEPSSPSPNQSMFSFRLGNWLLLGLCTHVTGKVSGAIETSQLKWLQLQLETHNQIPCAIFMHHPPIGVGSPWLDAIGLENKAELYGIIKDHPMVKGIFCGHVHQAFKGQLGAATVYTVPSTSVQFKPHRDRFELDPISPGYRLIAFNGATFKTEVIRVDVQP